MKIKFCSIVVIAIMGLISGCHTTHIAEYGQLPTGTIMKATMVSGGNYPTSPETNPLPALFRVDAITIDGSDFVDTNTKNCFVVANAVGNLSTERVDCRLTSFSCLDSDGKAIVDKSIKGFVVGADGRAGIPGKCLVPKIITPDIGVSIEVKSGQSVQLVISESVEFKIRN